MRYFGFSVATALVAAVAMNFPPVGIPVMFFGGIPMMILYLPLAFFPRAVASSILIYGGTLVGMGLHILNRKGDTLYMDSKYTLFSAAWLPIAFYTFKMFCALDQKCS